VSRIDVARFDVDVDIRTVDDNVRFEARRVPRRGLAAPGQIFEIGPAEALSDPANGHVADVLEASLRVMAARLVRSVNGYDRRSSPLHQALGRFVLSIPDSQLRSLPWEGAFSRLIHRFRPTLLPLIVVRRSEVRWREEELPFTLPLRILQLRDGARVSVPESISMAFGNRPPWEWERAARVETIWLGELTAYRREVPVVHVLHLTPDRSWSDVVTSNDAEKVGSLGWLSRLVDTWQTRLVILEAPTVGQAETTRVLAQALADRGGPGVLVAAGDDLGILTRFYDRLIHDDPIDVAAAQLGSPMVAVGRGRAEGLRVSTAPVRLMEIASRIDEQAPPLRRTDPSTRDLSILINRLEGPEAGRLLQPHHTSYLRSMITEQISTLWDAIEYRNREQSGILPTADALHNLRDLARAWRPATRPQAPDRPRFVSPTLLRSRRTGTPKAVRPSSALWLGEPVQLAVQIGERDRRVKVIGSNALIEEVFAWTPDMAGQWIEIGVTGITFEVLGNPVQEIWLPRTGPSDEAIFTVVPAASPLSVLRFSLFHRNNVVQSFRLVATTRLRGMPRPSDDGADGNARLARALGLPDGAVRSPGWAVAMEYALAEQIGHAGVPPRGLSIVANDLDGQSKITIKTVDAFVDATADLPAYVGAIRTAMDPDPESTDYPYLASQDALEATLRRLAEGGWALYSQVVPRPFRTAIAQALDDDDQTIHVAEIVVEKVIPWAAIYDREYDAKSLTVDGQPTASAVCLAPLRNRPGSPTAARCAIAEDCVLSAQSAALRAQVGEPDPAPNRVVCPRHFWGFRHVIELPIQQVEQGEHPRPLETVVNPVGPLNACIAFNPQLPNSSTHVTGLTSLLSTSRNVSLRPPVSGRQDILQTLSSTDLDIVYIICHAFGDKTKGLFPPYLIFFDNPEARVDPGQLDADPWSHHPLVILNGCKTGAVSADALSPFIKTLVRDRQAGGLLATEIAVWEPLAINVADVYLDHFLSGKTAGEALLAMRLDLLAEGNPLGLAYTLYGSADLTLSGAGGTRP
jgi:hypothetical protein